MKSQTFHKTLSRLALTSTPTTPKFHKRTSERQRFSQPSSVVYRNLSVARKPACDGDICTIGSSVTDAIEELADIKRQQLQRLRKEMGDKVLGHVTVNTTLGGMRGSALLLCETSQLDPFKGITIRGHHIQDLIHELPTSCDPISDPKGSKKGAPLSEGLLWLLLTGKMPTTENIKSIDAELKKKMHLPAHVFEAILSVPKETHPMTQFIVGISACQTESHFAKKYKQGMRKTDYWKPMLEDGLSLLAKLPSIAAFVYRRTYKDGQIILPDANLDWAANAAHMMGLKGDDIYDVMRLYLFIHADHEGGNVSAHSAHLVASVLSDLYLSFAASMAGLAGPLHGLANQESLHFLKDMQNHLKELNQEATNESVSRYVKDLLSSGRVVPGFGHAVLRAIDPRFTIQREFAETRMKDDELFKLITICLDVVPPILAATGKVANPYPNVDFHSGVILTHYGIPQGDFFTVMFGLSRALGVVSQLVWDRIFGLPIERPKSLTLDSLEEMMRKDP